MLPDDLPQDFLEFNARFGTDEQCREYLFPGALAGRLPLRRLRS